MSFTEGSDSTENVDLVVTEKGLTASPEVSESSAPNLLNGQVLL